VGEGEEDRSHVIFTLLVNSEHPIEALAGFAGRTRAPKPDDDYLYRIHHFKFDEPGWSERAEQLDAGVRHGLDLLDATGVTPEELRHPDVWVRAHFTFPLGAETIGAEVVERLGRIHATVWIDNNNG
jgi:hypothetical protein